MSERAKHTKIGSRGAFAVLLPALFASGVAALVNQVVWQRALKLMLGGSEALSAMAVVFVFILGLSLGSALMSRRADRSRSPFIVFAKVEAGLGALNLLVALALSTVSFGFMVEIQGGAVSLGLPLRIVQWLLAVAVLIVPCTLMGATQPLAAAALDRSVGAKAGAIPLVIGANTAGSVLGAWAGGFELLPRVGQVRLLIGAAALNLVVAISIYWLGRRLGEPVRAEATTREPIDGDRTLAAKPTTPNTPTEEGHVVEPWTSPRCMVGFALGFVALAYEMLLFRAMALAHGPLPTIFSAALVGYLFIWTIGATLARYARGALWPWLLLLTLSLVMIPWVHAKDRAIGGETLGYVALCYLLPCLFFGVLYGAMAERGTSKLGERLGRYAALNTAGSCAGVLVATLVFYEIFLPRALLLVASVAGLSLLYWLARTAELRLTAPFRFASVLALIGLVGASWRWSRADSIDDAELGRVYSSRDGVVEVHPSGRVMWDGLWHAQFAKGADYVGTSHWLLSLLPALSHSGEPKTGLVIGLGSGITVASMARMDTIEKVVVYDLNARLQVVHREHGQGTLYALQNPKVDMRWQEARTALALSDEKFDLISQQPLYLKQAGSSALLSKEYFELVRSRLNPGGVFCIYSNSFGNDRQAIVVRDTARRVFRHTASFKAGYLLVVSDDPIDLDEVTLTERLGRSGALYAEARAFDRRARNKKGSRGLLDLLDVPPRSWNSRGIFVTDDQPLIEYTKLFETKKPWIMKPFGARRE